MDRNNGDQKLSADYNGIESLLESSGGYYKNPESELMDINIGRFIKRLSRYSRNSSLELRFERNKKKFNLPVLEEETLLFFVKNIYDILSISRIKRHAYWSKELVWLNMNLRSVYINQISNDAISDLMVKKLRSDILTALLDNSDIKKNLEILIRSCMIYRESFRINEYIASSVKSILSEKYKKRSLLSHKKSLQCFSWIVELSLQDNNAFSVFDSGFEFAYKHYAGKSIFTGYFEEYVNSFESSLNLFNPLYDKFVLSEESRNRVLLDKAQLIFIMKEISEKLYSFVKNSADHTDLKEKITLFLKQYSNYSEENDRAANENLLSIEDACALLDIDHNKVVQRTLDSEVLKKQFREKAHIYHPDKGFESTEQMFHKISDARDILEYYLLTGEYLIKDDPLT